MPNKELTKRELEILKLTSKGFSSTEISRLSGTREQTVRNQKVSICLKLGAKNGANAIAIAKDRGII
jgi:two-component system response regulator DesR